MSIIGKLFGSFLLDKFDGTHTFLTREGWLCEFTYRAKQDSFDVDFIGKAKGGKDIWDDLEEHEKRSLLHQINDLTGEWRRSVGVKGRATNGSPCGPRPY